MYPTPSQTAFPQDIVPYPSVKGFPVARVVTVPNTTAQAEQLREQQAVVADADKVKKDTFSNKTLDQRLDSRGQVFFVSRTNLSQADAQKFLLKNHYKTDTTSTNSYMDQATGKVYLYGKKAPELFFGK